jgi:hypothetical protein
MSITKMDVLNMKKAAFAGGLFRGVERTSVG